MYDFPYYPTHPMTSITGLKETFQLDLHWKLFCSTWATLRINSCAMPDKLRKRCVTSQSSFLVWISTTGRLMLVVVVVAWVATFPLLTHLRASLSSPIDSNRLTSIICCGQIMRVWCHQLIFKVSNPYWHCDELDTGVIMTPRRPRRDACLRFQNGCNVLPRRTESEARFHQKLSQSGTTVTALWQQNDNKVMPE